MNQKRFVQVATPTISSHMRAPSLGLHNRGNTCYINAAVTALLAGSTARIALSRQAQHSDVAGALTHLARATYQAVDAPAPREATSNHLQTLEASLQHTMERAGNADTCLQRLLERSGVPFQQLRVDPPHRDPLWRARSSLYRGASSSTFSPSAAKPVVITLVEDPLRIYPGGAQCSAELRRASNVDWRAWDLECSMTIAGDGTFEYVCVGLVCIQTVQRSVEAAVPSGINHFVSLVRPTFGAAAPDVWTDHVEAVGSRCLRSKHWWVVNDRECFSTQCASVSDISARASFDGNGETLAQHVVAMVHVLQPVQRLEEPVQRPDGSVPRSQEPLSSTDAPASAQKKKRTEVEDLAP